MLVGILKNHVFQKYDIVNLQIGSTSVELCVKESRDRLHDRLPDMNLLAKDIAKELSDMCDIMGSGAVKEDYRDLAEQITVNFAFFPIKLKLLDKRRTQQEFSKFSKHMRIGDAKHFSDAGSPVSSERDTRAAHLDLSSPMSSDVVSDDALLFHGDLETRPRMTDSCTEDDNYAWQGEAMTTFVTRQSTIFAGAEPEVDATFNICCLFAMFWLAVCGVWVIQFFCGFYFCYWAGVARQSFWGQVLTHIIFAFPIAAWVVVDTGPYGSDEQKDQKKSGGPGFFGTLCGSADTMQRFFESPCGKCIRYTWKYFINVLIFATAFIVVCYMPFYWPMGMVPASWADRYSVDFGPVKNNLNVSQKLDKDRHTAIEFRFSGSAEVAVSSAYIHNNAYCVAPIVANAASLTASTPVYYWAVCDVSGANPYDGEQECTLGKCPNWAKNVKFGSGIDFPAEGSFYLKAIRKTHWASLADDAVLLQWAKDRDIPRKRAYMKAVFLTVSAVIISSIIFWAIMWKPLDLYIIHHPVIEFSVVALVVGLLSAIYAGVVEYYIEESIT